MSFFRRKKDEPLIPPVAPPAGASAPRADPYAQVPSNSNRYGGAGGGDPYARSKPAAGDDNPYAKATDHNDAARNELFSGFSAPEKPKPERKYGYEGREMEEDFDEGEEVEGIKQEMRGIKQESLASTRNALRLAREAEENARGTVAKLADQSERIANSERYLDMAKANNQRAEDKAEELKKLNRSIFRPAVTWNKDAKRQAEEDKINERHAMERHDRAKALNDVTDTRRRLGNAANPSPYGSGYEREPLPGEQKAKKEARSRYQFDATASDDELEDELDDNLNETYEVTKRLKNLATAMGDEVTGQNQRLTRVTDKTENLEFAVMKNTERLKRIR
ncbi:synaptosomal-associated protein, 23kDa [Kwoniella mangroviensis CBS 10435]|uniref:Synaptosomal-associated protein, 23kDa n=1 Tax=Kwoniella mangroviensis CBS 10435 TaxID=1331196 RepID=A0A1B9IF40_9TREE|nr:synaptosomal-associated protein, 23kDa [Kwoniella mangroviensis CBS 8507]OCF54259.1 synaptosomal-associated protein, 23kDa [Kwoniella mangroviensis CBS 10435]OCF63078.1 synaptosomal-associated protein, 23kDa [Kwoniella mangroviensis CBS 8507]OCF73990.1 synaptosomal-associated protein, 23kDa [Kwoniella mangroviensis CBS 8886]